MKKTVLTILAVALLASVAQAQLIVGNDQSGTVSIYDVNPTTGVATPIYTSSGNDAKPWGMAFDPDTNTLYWNNGSTLYSSPFGATLTPTNLGTMSQNYVALGFSRGRLYGTRNISTEAVYEINLNNLQHTLIYQYPSAFDFGGIDFDASNGVLYGVTDSAPSGSTRGLYEIDLNGLTQIFKAGYPGGETDIDGLAVNNGIAYLVTDGPNTSQANFYMIDVATGQQVGTIPSPFTGSGTFCAAAWVPEPSALVLLLVGGALLRRR